ADKAYPRDFMQRGRVRVQLKMEDGTAINPSIPTTAIFSIICLWWCFSFNLGAPNLPACFHMPLAFHFLLIFIGKAFQLQLYIGHFELEDCCNLKRHQTYSGERVPDYSGFYNKRLLLSSFERKGPANQKLQ
ncbi:hypothetical protein KI387_017596, partial [Taxus chinensis]